jgi:hypothetical protein
VSSRGGLTARFQVLRLRRTSRGANFPISFVVEHIAVNVRANKACIQELSSSLEFKLVARVTRLVYRHYPHP